MKKQNRKMITALILVFVLSIGLLAGCGQQGEAGVPLSTGGKLMLRVNPEIEITYDEEGLVTAIEGINEDGSAILEGYDDFLGKECKSVVRELVERIGEAGYFIEEVEGESRQITIEIENGSIQPSETFLDDIVTEVRQLVAAEGLENPLVIEGESNYGISDYTASDYGDISYTTGSSNYDDNGTTDYQSNQPAASSGSSSGAASSARPSGNTNYDDGGTTDYSGNSTNYDDGGTTNYEDNGTNYDDGGTTNYEDNASNYDDGGSNYDSGDSNYDDGGSNYDDGDSGYDD